MGTWKIYSAADWKTKIFVSFGLRWSQLNDRRQKMVPPPFCPLPHTNIFTQYRHICSYLSHAAFNCYKTKNIYTKGRDTIVMFNFYIEKRSISIHMLLLFDNCCSELSYIIFQFLKSVQIYCNTYAYNQVSGFKSVFPAPPSNFHQRKSATPIKMLIASPIP